MSTYLFLILAIVCAALLLVENVRLYRHTRDLAVETDIAGTNVSTIVREMHSREHNAAWERLLCPIDESELQVRVSKTYMRNFYWECPTCGGRIENAKIVRNDGSPASV